MTIAQLKKVIEFLPDDAVIIRSCGDYNFCEAVATATLAVKECDNQWRLDVDMFSSYTQTPVLVIG